MSTLSTTLIQTSLHWEDKAANLNMFEDKISSLSEPSHIVILPEMFSTGFSMRPEVLAEKMDGETVNWMKKMARQYRRIITGSLIIEDDDEYFNRLIWMLPTGEYGYYNKRHLFAYAGEDQHYTAGSERLIASVNGWKINLQVCYDLRFPVWNRQAPGGQNGALEFDLLIFVANWPERRNIAWKTLLQARAIENQCYVVGVNRVGKDGNDIYHSGNSMVVDPMGEILYHQEHEEDVFTITFDKEHLQQVRERFPFWKDRDDFKILT